ncbi:MAG TPA: hydrogenase expression/formation C-terminal domain-containing protein [Usitatibacter sp.]|nr:hydrogenase expression/formation C-terminal domain-containing protein [Usitatibacter sp.]HUL57533.1 hydrogenase expression/formation C-terminal domain-containing protein [Usitatibacter sp.]
MSGLDKIAVKVVDGADAPTGNVRALMHELAQLVDAWTRGGEPASIDLRSLPLTRGDYAELDTVLGAGAVSASVEAFGASEVRESQYPGVWRVTHRNEAGEVVADLVEICEVPLILRAPGEDVTDGLIRLKEALQP